MVFFFLSLLHAAVWTDRYILALDSSSGYLRPNFSRLRVCVGGFVRARACVCMRTRARTKREGRFMKKIRALLFPVLTCI